MKYLICYTGFFILSWLAKSNDGNKLFDEKGAVRNPGTLIGLQIGGILWLGLVPFFIFKKSLSSIVFGNTSPEILPLIIFFVLAGVIVFVATRQSRKDMDAMLNKGIATILSSSFIVRYIIVRFIFLCVYEVFFRGFLLNDSINQLGIPLAITINIALYVLIHIFSGRKEIIGSIPFGLVLCAVSILFNAVWPAIVLHLALSFTYEISSLKRIKQSLKPVV
jgi:membrane protease YdiL (CAAX protease family)